jgi:hypothetical protein
MNQEEKKVLQSIKKPEKFTWKQKIVSKRVPSTIDGNQPLPEEGGNMLIVKGESSTEKSVEHHTAGPNVHLRARVEFTRDHLVQDKQSRR